MNTVEAESAFINSSQLPMLKKRKYRNLMVLYPSALLLVQFKIFFSLFNDSFKAAYYNLAVGSLQLLFPKPMAPQQQMYCAFSHFSITMQKRLSNALDSLLNDD
ncbi:hypothetical protein GBG21_15165 [Aeribacillus pallidus]